MASRRSTATSPSATRSPKASATPTPPVPTACAALARLAGTGAQLLVWTAFEPGESAIHRPVRGRFALYNELVRESADRHGAAVVDFWRLQEYRDWRLWDADRMHLGPAGHQRMAIEVLDILGVEHALVPLELGASLLTNAARTPASPGGE